jgi:general secretion pathway protein J
MMNKQKDNRCAGFTLLEILIALFIFTILSFVLTSALRTVMNAQAGTEDKAERIRKLQMALLVISRDVEQAVNRPITNANGKEEAAFVGKIKSFEFTHAGFANPTGALAHSTLQRTGYTWNENILFRLTWPVLDQAPETQAHKRILLMKVTEVRFQYLDKNGRFHDAWPLDGEGGSELPRGVRIYLTIAKWGKMSQLYLIPAQPSNNKQTPNKSSTSSSSEAADDRKTTA